jgi:hypothetical protein
MKTEIYIRALPGEGDFDEETFLSSRSFDLFVVENPQSKDGAEELIEKYGLPGHACFRHGGWGVEYDGINALPDEEESHDDLYRMGYREVVDTLVTFEGECLGFNLHGDGEIVRPIKILKVKGEEKQ